MDEPVILIVDDSPLELLGMREALEREGFEIVTFQIRSFTEVFQLSEIVLHERPALILMDVNLGLSSYDGARLAKTIRRLREPGRRYPLIVLHSARTAPELLALQRQCEADGFLEKGDLPRLAVKLRQILARYPAPRAS